MGPLTTSPEGYKYLLNCIDLNTSWPESQPLRTLTALELTSAIQKIIICRHAQAWRFVFLKQIFKAVIFLS
jgi:hypothetical protein